MCLAGSNYLQICNNNCRKRASSGRGIELGCWKDLARERVYQRVLGIMFMIISYGNNYGINNMCWPLIYWFLVYPLLSPEDVAAVGTAILYSFIFQHLHATKPDIWKVLWASRLMEPGMVLGCPICGRTNGVLAFVANWTGVPPRATDGHDIM